jgi:hypothetical protein
VAEPLPDPLVPAEVDLRGYEFMPYYGDRLRESDLNSRATDAEYRAAHNLWWSSWKQVPAGSLPNDDVTLCKLADLGRDQKTWLEVKERALHGFRLCNDNRWYHQLISMLALSVFDARSKAQARGKLGASKRWNGQGNAPSTDIHARSTKNDSKGDKRTSKQSSVVNALPTEERQSAAAAADLIIPENLSQPEKHAVAELLKGNSRAQELLDELAGVMAKRGTDNPQGLLITLIRQVEHGVFVPSHAPRIRAEREGKNLKVELEASGRTKNGDRTAPA